jgi:hypothetical protein
MIMFKEVDMTLDELNKEYFKVAGQLDNEAKNLLLAAGFRSGNRGYMNSANESNAVSVARRFIDKSAKNHTDGFIRLFKLWKETKNNRIQHLTIEAIYLEFNKKYGADFPEEFPTSTVNNAKSAMTGW